MMIFPITLSIVLGSSLFVALIINSMLTSEYMKIEEKAFSRRRLIRISGILGVAGLCALIAGYVLPNGLLRATGNLLILGGILMWLYRYVLKGAVNYFQYTFLTKLESFYENSIKFALRGKNAYFFFVGTVALFIISLALMAVIRPNVLFFPDNEPRQIMVYIEYPEGTDIQKTNELAKRIEDRVFSVVNQYEDASGYNFMVESAISQVGEGTGNPMTDMGQQNEMPHRAKITLSLRDYQDRRGVSSNDVLSEVREAVKGFPGASVIVEKDNIGPPSGYPVNLELQGEDYSAMLTAAENLRSFIQNSGIQGIEELKIDVNKSKPELDVRVDRSKAGQLGVTTGQVGQTLRRAIYGEEITTYKEGDDDYEVNVRLQEDQRYNENILFNQPITFKDQNTGDIIQVPISSVVSLESSTAFSSIKRKDLKRVITLYSNVLQGYNGNAIVGELQQLLSSYELPQEISLEFTGEQEEQAENMDFLVTALLIALGGILLVLVAQFNSLSRPIIILLSVLLSLVGVFMGMYIFQMDFIIIMTMMGIISLAGIVVNNAIVLIDYIEILIDRKKKEEGLNKTDLLDKEQYYELIVAGGKSRLRPVLLTAITTVLGLIPLAVGLNIDFFSLIMDYDPKLYIGGDNVVFWGPLAWTVIFGLTFATFLTLIVVPVMFYLTTRIKIRAANRKESSPTDLDTDSPQVSS